MTRSLVPAIAVTLSALLLAAVGGALAWQEITDQFDQVFSGQLALVSHAKAEDLLRCREAAGKFLAQRQTGANSPQKADFPDGAVLLRRAAAGQLSVLADSDTRLDAEACRRLLPADDAMPLALGKVGDTPCLASRGHGSGRELWLVQPLRSLVAPTRVGLHALAQVALEPATDHLKTPAASYGPDLMVGVSTVVLDGLPVRVSVSCPRGSALRPALGRFVRYVLSVSVPILLCLCLLGIMAGRAVVTVMAERRRAAERAALHHIGQALLSTSGLADVLRCIVDQSRDIFGATGAYLAVRRGGQGGVAIEVASPEGGPSGLTLAPGQGLAGQVVASGEGLLLAAEASAPELALEPAERFGLAAASVCAAPLVDARGDCFGALCLVRTAEHPFVDNDLVLLRSIATTAALATERARTAEQEREHERLAHELDIARTVQRGLLPAGDIVLPDFEVAGASEPAHEVGGDFYDAQVLEDGRLALVIADVADKGLGAAMFMVLCRSLYYACGAGRRQPAETLADLNSRLAASNPSNLFVTMFHAVVDLASGTVSYACAGHPPPLVYRAESRGWETVQARGTALGVIDPAPLASGDLRLDAGDILLLYTDGVTDATDGSGAMLGMEGLLTALDRIQPTSAVGLVGAIMDTLATHAGGTDPFDDTTLLVLSRCESLPQNTSQ